MAVLVEALSVIVRKDSIESKFIGGKDAFLDLIPNTTFCYDDELARIGFMTPTDVEAFIENLEMHGLQFRSPIGAVDIAVVDQLHGPTTDVSWLEVSQIGIGDGRKVTACWLFEGEKIGYGVHIKGESLSLAVPEGWVYENSISSNTNFVLNEDIRSQLEFIRTDGSVDVFLDAKTGGEVFIGRTNRGETLQ